VPEVKLVRGIHDAPTILDRFGYRKEKYLAVVRAVTLGHFKDDDVVYHGLAGHFLVQGVSHVLKVRILADIEDRVRWEMEREGISAQEARRNLEADDEQRRKWSKHLFGIDTHDPRSYDLVLHTKRISVDDAVDMICLTARLPNFQATEESHRIITDMALAAEVSAALVDTHPELEVSSRDGVVVVRATVSMVKEAAVVEQIEKVVMGVSGVKEVQVAAHSSFMDV
jgi:hypothetical protein